MARNTQKTEDFECNSIHTDILLGLERSASESKTGSVEFGLLLLEAELLMHIEGLNLNLQMLCKRCLLVNHII